MAAHPAPERFFDMMSGVQKSAALQAAVDLGIFGAIADGATTSDAVAARTGASPKGARILCDYMCTTGLLAKSGDAYALTEESAFFLVPSSPAYLGGTLRFMLGPMINDAYGRLTESVRKGSTAMETGSMAPDHPAWRDFARAMIPMMMPAAMFMAGALHREGDRKILDVAAGHGIFGILLAQRNPEARVTACDWAAVLDVARENAERFGVADRWTALPGSIFDAEPGGGYDLILLTNFLHHFSPATIGVLLRKLHAQLAPGGRCATLEFVPGPDRVSPPVPSQFALTMLATTSEGDAYTFAEYEAMFAEAGFSGSQFIPIPGQPGSLIVSER